MTATTCYKAMHTTMRNRRLPAPQLGGWLLLMATALVVAGCHEGQTLKGTVTVGGEPVPMGHIGFAPVDGEGKRVGTTIKNGAYALDGLVPGTYRVYVTGTTAPQAPIKTREEAMQADASAPQVLIDLEHPDNGQEVEITASTSTLDFDY